MVISVDKQINQIRVYSLAPTSVHICTPTNTGAASKLLTGDELQPKQPQTMSGHQLGTVGTTMGQSLPLVNFLSLV